MEGLILAAGRGTRLGELGERLPKALLYLPGGPLIDYQLQIMERLGIGHVFVVVGHQWSLLADYLRGRPGIELIHQDGPPTLWGALESARPALSGPTLVVHGDNYLSAPPLDLVQALGERPAVFYQGQVGIYALRPEALAWGGSLEDLRARSTAIPLSLWRQNINDLRDLLMVNGRLLSTWHHASHPSGADHGYRPLGTLGQIQPPCWVSRRADLEETWLGPSVTVGPGARLSQVRLANAVVFPGGRLEGRQLARGVVVDQAVYLAG